ncbi:MAG: Coiled-coil domain-containing protein 90B, mitochondrial, partial [Paramarteilia canceri]
KLKLQIASLNESFDGELKKINSSLKLELFDQKSFNLGTTAANELKINKLDNKIDIEIATIKTMIESNRYNGLRYFLATIFSASAL